MLQTIDSFQLPTQTLMLHASLHLLNSFLPENPLPDSPWAFSTSLLPHPAGYYEFIQPQLSQETFHNFPIQKYVNHTHIVLLLFPVRDFIIALMTLKQFAHFSISSGRL